MIVSSWKMRTDTSSNGVFWEGDVLTYYKKVVRLRKGD